jgi:hypothetical protein
MSAPEKHRTVAGSRSAKMMSRWISWRISLGFDDPAGHSAAGKLVNDDFAEQIARQGNCLDGKLSPAQATNEGSLLAVNCDSTLLSTSIVRATHGRRAWYECTKQVLHANAGNTVFYTRLRRVRILTANRGDPSGFTMGLSVRSRIFEWHEDASLMGTGVKGGDFHKKGELDSLPAREEAKIGNVRDGAVAIEL